MDIAKSFKNLKNIQIGGKSTNKKNVSMEPKTIKEINLVPDIKNDFIKTLKFRNLVFFLSIIIASGSVIVMLTFLTIAGGQQGFINSKQTTIDALQKKISDYSDLSDFLTIRDQLSNIATITENKVMMSRTFNILSAIIPTGDDYINISELSVDLSGEDEKPMFTIDAQANAGSDPQIDYKVLDSFKKSMRYLRYDYGEYVDKDDQTIPAYCMIETAEDGSILRDTEKGYFAYWLIEGEGCNPSAEDEEDEEYEEEEEENSDSVKSTSLLNTQSLNTSSLSTTKLDSEESLTKVSTPEELSQKTGYQIENYNGQNVVKIWRTPQYTEWYKKDPKESEPYMDLDGSIHDIPHFNSSCISYSGTEKDNSTITWTATNDSCQLVPEDEGEEDNAGIIIESSSNGRNADEELVLRFNAKIFFAPEVFNFNNHHMITLSPAGRRNVTDSYAQIQSIFAERASDCDQSDTECITTPTSADADSSDDQNSTNNWDQPNQYGEDEEEEEW